MQVLPGKAPWRRLARPTRLASNVGAAASGPAQGDPMNARLVFGVLTGLFIHLGAHAQASGSLEFTIDSLTPLGASPTAPLPPGAAGHWLSSGWVFGTIGTSAGQSGPSRSEGLYAITHPIAGLDGPPFGNFDYSLPATAAQPASASMFLHPGSLGVAWETPLPTTSAGAQWNWTRVFALNPGASISLEGSFSHSSSLGETPTRTFSSEGFGHPDPGQPFNNSAGIYRIAEPASAADPLFSYAVQGQLTNVNPLDSGSSASPATSWVPSARDFEYSLDSFGHASMTIFNRSSDPLFGWLSLGVSAWSPVAAIPEPATWMTMLLGVALLGAMRNRRTSATTA
jgi:hypothetical protein